MPATFSLRGFRAFRAEVYRQLATVGLNSRAVTDRALIDSWLADESPAALVGRLLESPTADRGQGGAQ
jgi:hypothetical protein